MALPILVVDDRKENREAAKAAFDELEIEVVFATNFQQAKEMMESDEIFRFCLLDVEMPKVEGDEPKAHHFELEKVAQATNQQYVFVTTGNNHGILEAAHWYEVALSVESDRSKIQMNVMNGVPVYAHRCGPYTKAQPDSWKWLWIEAIVKLETPSLLKAKELLRQAKRDQP